jgi:hypothetical protein
MTISREQRERSKQKSNLADQLSELCHELDPNSNKWSASVRSKFNKLYSELTEIDET